MGNGEYFGSNQNLVIIDYIQDKCDYPWSSWAPVASGSQKVFPLLTPLWGPVNIYYSLNTLTFFYYIFNCF